MLREILVLPHSHYDHGFVHPPSVERVLQVRFWRDALDLLEQDPGMAWCSELTAPVLDWLATAGADEIARARRLVAAGRLGVGALRWNTTPLSDAGELRDLAAGAARMRAALGDPCRVAFQHDVNGIPWPAVGILRDAGVDTLAMAINVHQGGCAVGRHRLFRWRGPDGRHLTVLNGDHYNAFARIVRPVEGTVAAMRAGWAEYEARLAGWQVNTPFLYLTATLDGCDDCNPPNRDLPAWIQRWNDERVGPPVRLVTPEGLRQAIQALDPATLPEFAGDWTDFWNFGAGSSAAHTSLARRARRRLRQAETIAPAAIDPVVAAQVRDQVALYHEHTWGSPVGCGNFRSVEPTVQWDHKAANASTAAALADLCRRDALHRRSGNADWGNRPAGVLVVNAGNSPRRFSPSTCGYWQEAYFRYHAGSRNIWDALADNAGGIRAWGSLALPARSWRILSWDELAALPAAPATVADGAIAGCDLDLAFDPASGRITGLTRRRDGWRMLAGDLDLVHERVDHPDPAQARQVFYRCDWPTIYRGLAPWVADWPAQRRTAERSQARVETSPTGATLIRSLDLPGWDGCELHATLRGDAPGLDLRLVGRLRDTVHPESWYLALPLALPAGWRCHFDTAGASVELDAEQLPGASRDWVTVDRWIAMHHGGRCAVLACPDAPLVMPAGFAYGLNRAAIPRAADPLLLAWPMNTYWQTNFRAAQPGPIDLRWHLAAPDGFSPAAADASADAVDDGIVAHPVLSLPEVRQGGL